MVLSFVCAADPVRVNLPRSVSVIRTRILLLTVDNGPTRKQRAGERTPAGRRARWTEDVSAA